MNGGDDVALIHLDTPIKETRFGKVSLGAFANGSAVYAIGRTNNGRFGTTLWVSPQMTVSGQDTAHRFWVAVGVSVGENGDSGGPLILTATQEIIGVDSLGGSCGAQKLCEVFGMVGGDPSWFMTTFERYAGYPLGSRVGGGGGDGGVDAIPGGSADAEPPPDSGVDQGPGAAPADAGASPDANPLPPSGSGAGGMTGAAGADSPGAAGGGSQAGAGQPSSSGAGGSGSPLIHNAQGGCACEVTAAGGLPRADLSLGSLVALCGWGLLARRTRRRSKSAAAS